MIKIKIKQTESDCLIEVHGHARYAPIGKDIVCSAISVLFLTLANSIDETSDRVGCKGTEEAYPECVELRDV